GIQRKACRRRYVGPSALLTRDPRTASQARPFEDDGRGSAERKCAAAGVSRLVVSDTKQSAKEAAFGVVGGFAGRVDADEQGRGNRACVFAHGEDRAAAVALAVAENTVLVV